MEKPRSREDQTRRYSLPANKRRGTGENSRRPSMPTSRTSQRKKRVQFNESENERMCAMILFRRLHKTQKLEFLVKKEKRTNLKGLEVEVSKND